MHFIAGKAAYNEKVDIYSLGIIFFEMCHPPLMTGMERIKVLSSLRLPEIVLPCSEHSIGKDEVTNKFYLLLKAEMNLQT